VPSGWCAASAAAPAAGSFKVLRPQDTALVADPSPLYRDTLPYQLEPAAMALAIPRQRLLIVDAVGLGKTLECGILCSELIHRGRGKLLLVVTTKSMLVQFQKEFWTRFSIPLVRLDSLGIQRIREQIPTNQNPFHSYDKAIVSVDTLKNDRDYRFYLDNASWDIIVIDECQNVSELARGAQKSQRARLAEVVTQRPAPIPSGPRPVRYILLITILVAFLEAMAQQLQPIRPPVVMGLSGVLRHGPAA
jgi:SNF2 family DNA or RNA helicase